MTNEELARLKAIAHGKSELEFDQTFWSDGGTCIQSLIAEIERLTKERDEYKIWWERDSTLLGKALNEVSSLRAQVEQWKARVASATEEILNLQHDNERLMKSLNAEVNAHEPLQQHRHWTKDGAVPYLNCLCDTCAAARSLHGASRDASSEHGPLHNCPECQAKRLRMTL